MSLTWKRLREVVSYDPVTGVFTWKPRHRLRHVAKDGRAGSVNKTGYRYLLIDGQKYKAARLAWLYSFKHWPVHQIDHVNGIRDDDRLSNLRDATPAQNNQNHKPHRNSRSGVRGVHQLGNKWRASIRVNGRNRHLGVFDHITEASQAYLAARANAFPFQPVPRER